MLKCQWRQCSYVAVLGATLTGMLPMNSRMILLPLAALITASFSPGEQQADMVDAQLKAALEQLIEPFEGEVSIYVRQLGVRRYAQINADELCPTASLIKVPILAALFDKIAAGNLDYHANLEYHDSLLYPGVDILGSFKSGEKISLRKVIMLMITTSDNTASLWCQTLAHQNFD